ncbi:unnamed protein product [Peniophora sp. CBMAI 1063]|nr:unnamed protein product [Peniophora sp. CBMAI 1063]
MLATRLRTPALRRLARAASSSSPSSSSVPAETPKGNSPGTVAGSQSPNYPTQWSLNQRARPTPTDGARFEQTIMELQPQPLSAMAMIAEEPVRMVKGRKAVCDGGHGPLGHPKIFINLDKPGPKACGYCGFRYEQEPHHHH